MDELGQHRVWGGVSLNDGDTGLKKTRQTFDDGETIFREGDPSDTAYEIVSGNVEIAKRGEDGEVRLAILNKDEIFGEMGVLDDRKRNATAKAAGPVIVNAIPRKDFLEAIRDKPELAISILRKMSERLRDADGKLGGSPPEIPPAAPSPGADDGKPQQLPPGGPGNGEEEYPAESEATGFWGKLLGIKRVARAEKLHILVAPLAGEEGAALARKVAQTLKRQKGLRVKSLRKPLLPETVDSSGETTGGGTLNSLVKARAIMAKAEADLLVWGEVVPPGMMIHLKFISFASWNDDPPGAFHGDATLPLPTEFGKPFADFLHAVTLAAIVPQSKGKAATLNRDLPLALDSARPVLDAAPGDLTQHERGLFHAAYANSLVRVAAGNADTGLYNRSAEIYKECLAILSEADAPLDWAFAQKNLGLTLQILAERTDDEAPLDEAADALRAALRILNKNDHPLDWAAAQNRLGEVLYRLDFKSGDTAMLKHALGAYQSALQVYTKTGTPMRWAETMNNFAQATQVLGDQLKNPEALEKAVQACRAALEIRTKQKVPVLWASTQNNLGSALFLLGKMTNTIAHLEGAAEAFDLARSFYQSRGMDRMAGITEKNIGHVNQLLSQSTPKGMPKMNWEKDAE